MAHVDALNRAALVRAVSLERDDVKQSQSEEKAIGTLKNRCLSAIVCAVKTEITNETDVIHLNVCPDALVCVLLLMEVTLIGISRFRNIEIG